MGNELPPTRPRVRYRRRLAVTAAALGLALTGCTWRPPGSGGTTTTRAVTVPTVTRPTTTSTGSPTTSRPTTTTRPPTPPGGGLPKHLHGVNRSGTEYACIQGNGIFDGPNTAASVQAIASWKANVVRVPLNEDCWLGRKSGLNAAYTGAAYRTAITDYVKVLNNAGLVAILDLHWAAPNGRSATAQTVMVDADNGPDFWTSVAGTFKSTPSVVYDLFNEPHDISWDCWKNGCTTSDGWKTAGMQSLVNAVRNTGARQPIMLGGLAWANDLSGWLANKPNDPANNLMASFHLYNFNACKDQGCWNSTIAPVAKVVPVVTGELGENDCAHGFIDQYMPWADAHGISYLGWTWTNWAGKCADGPVLITDYNGTPSNFGVGFKNHFAQLN